MSEILISRRGEKLSDVFATIAVTYPAGSTCTCSNGSRIFTAKDTSGSFLFSIPETGTWVVKCTNGIKTVSKNVSITKKWQGVNVILRYELILFDINNRNLVSKAFSNTSSTGEPAITIADNIYMSCPDNASISVLTTNKVDLSNYDTLYATVIQFKVNRPSYTRGWILVDTDRTTMPYNYGSTPQNFTAITELSSLTTGSIDISKISGQYYVGYGLGVHGSVTISKIWLA